MKFFLFSDGQLVTVKMEKLSSHIQTLPVKKQYIILGGYQYLKSEKNMHYLFTGVYHKSPTAEQERPFHIEIYIHKKLA